MRRVASLLRLTAALAICGAAAFAQHVGAAHAAPDLGSPFDPAAMDRSVDACNNFFGYATGTWRKRHPIPPAYSEYGYIEALTDHTLDIVRATLDAARAQPGPIGRERQQIGAFYGSCLDTTAIERAGLVPLAPELARIAALQSWTQLGSELAHLQAIGVDAGFAVHAEPDPKRSELMIASIDQAGIGLPDRDYYLRTDAESKRTRTQYVVHVGKMLGLSGDPQGSADAAMAVAFESVLARASKPTADLRDPLAVYHPLPLARLDALGPHLGFRAYLAAVAIPATGTINVSVPAFVHAIDRSIVDEPLQAWRAYLRWRLLDADATSLPARFDNESFVFNGQILNGAKQQQPRWKRCIAAEDPLLGEAVGRAYVAVGFPASAKARALEMSERIRSAYRAEMQNLSWMSVATKKIAIAKLDAMGLKVGYPDHWPSYAGYSVAPHDYLGNVVRGRLFAFAFAARQIGKPVDHSLWYMTPQTVNAYNAISPNEIVLPAAQLQRPFFDEHAPDADNLGATGAGTVGHEMTHGFDDEGHKYDLHGNLANWWTPVDLAQFNRRAHCIVKQFDDTIAVGTTHYIGRLDSGEAIADFGGVVIGYRALETALAGKPRVRTDGFTPEQRYFLAFAQSWTESVRPEYAKREALTDPHPLPRDRVNNTLANVPGWYRAFDCRMPPQPVCDIW